MTPASSQDESKRFFQQPLKPALDTEESRVDAELKLSSTQKLG